MIPLLLSMSFKTGREAATYTVLVLWSSISASVSCFEIAIAAFAELVVPGTQVPSEITAFRTSSLTVNATADSIRIARCARSAKAVNELAGLLIFFARIDPKSNLAVALSSMSATKTYTLTMRNSVGAS